MISVVVTLTPTPGFGNNGVDYKNQFHSYSKKHSISLDYKGNVLHKENMQNSHSKAGLSLSHPFLILFQRLLIYSFY